MSSYFHIAAGTAIAIGSRKSIGIELWSGPFITWMLVLILASNIADKDMAWDHALRKWARRGVKFRQGARFKAWCVQWFRHRMFCHSIIAMIFDLKGLIILTSLLQASGYLPSFNPIAFLLIALAFHLVVDTIDGSQGVALFAPSSVWMLKFPELFKDRGWAHMVSSEPILRKEFWIKVRREAAFTAALNSAAFMLSIWL